MSCTVQERTQVSATLEEERAQNSGELARLTQQAQAVQQQAQQLQAQVRCTGTTSGWLSRPVQLMAQAGPVAGVPDHLLARQRTHRLVLPVLTALAAPKEDYTSCELSDALISGCCSGITLLLVLTCSQKIIGRAFCVLLCLSITAPDVGSFVSPFTADVLPIRCLLCILLLGFPQLSQAHADHKKLRDQYSAEILARNADLAVLEAAEQKAAQLQEQLTAEKVR